HHENRYTPPQRGVDEVRSPPRLAAEVGVEGAHQWAVGVHEDDGPHCTDPCQVDPVGRRYNVVVRGARRCRRCCWAARRGSMTHPFLIPVRYFWAQPWFSATQPRAVDSAQAVPVPPSPTEPVHRRWNCTPPC